MKNKTDISENIEKCRERLSRLCLNLCRNYHDADDLFQDTVLRAVKYYDSFNDDTEFDKWIYKICVNTYKSGLRKLYRLRPIACTSEEEHDAYFSLIPDDDTTASKNFGKKYLCAGRRSINYTNQNGGRFNHSASLKMSCLKNESILYAFF